VTEIERRELAHGGGNCTPDWPCPGQ
jgi:hypothetical protein